MTTYRIRDWTKHFENNRTRELKEMRFVIIPNKHDGDGYTELLDHPNGAAHYGAWCCLVQVASKCDPRGTLLRDGAKPHDSTSLARLTRIPTAIFDEALPRLITIGWIETIMAQPCEQPAQTQPHSEIPQGGATSKAAKSRTPLPKSAPEWNGIEEKRKEEKKDIRPAKPRDDRMDHPALQAVLKIRGKYPTKDLWDLVIETLGEEPDVGRLRECWVAWRGKGFNSENYGWMTDWYISGIQGANNGTNKSTSNQTATERRESDFRGYASVVSELRSQSSGTTNETVRRKPFPS